MPDLSPPAPQLPSLARYGELLADRDWWLPYAHAVLARHNLPLGPIEPSFPGTYPTLLVGQLVVKLFGYFPSWRHNYDRELAAHRLLHAHPDVPAPALVAHGQLYADSAEPWPYLVTTRLDGRAWRAASLTSHDRRRVAGQVGAAIRAVHDLPVPEPSSLDGDWLATASDECADRHRSWGTLPDRLVTQLDMFLVPLHDRRLVHADLTEDHLFVRAGQLEGIIDWGDAELTDPHYELGALHLGAFAGDRTLLRAFLAGYGWRADDTFPRRALTAALLHRFDVFAGVRDTLDWTRTRRSTSLPAPCSTCASADLIGRQELRPSRDAQLPSKWHAAWSSMPPAVAVWRRAKA